MTSSFDRYVQLLDAARTRPDDRAEQLEALTRQSGADVKAAERSHNELAKLVAKSNDDLRRIRGPIERLAATSGVTADPASAQQCVDSLAEVESLMKALAADLRSAEESEDWLKRARASQQQLAAAAPPPTPPAAPSTPVATSSAPNRTLLIAIGVGVALVVLIVLILLVL